ncbi:MAG: hypothetical protein FH748_01155 [Balneolaceae bacterium]|nr:hypothetical protein [Balneolaceae bacterium]
MNVQAISLLGDSLRSDNQTLPEELVSRIDSLSKQALQDSLITQHLIWQGRLAAYNGNYRSAIDIYSDAIEDFPTEPKLYRHRGHRYITLRKFDRAIKDFEKAAELFNGEEDIIEQDGLPNPQNTPLSSLQTNTWYHLGLAHYLKEDYKKANEAYENGILAAQNDDMLVAFLYWYYMSLRRMGDDVQAGKMLEAVDADMGLIENDSYHQLLLVFKGVFTPEDILDDDATALENATLGYGLGNWHYINGRKDRAYQIWQNVYDAGNWASFGFIASEAELAKQ